MLNEILLKLKKPDLEELALLANDIWNRLGSSYAEFVDYLESIYPHTNPNQTLTEKECTTCFEIMLDYESEDTSSNAIIKSLQTSDLLVLCHFANEAWNNIDHYTDFIAYLDFVYPYEQTGHVLTDQEYDECFKIMLQYEVEGTGSGKAEEEINEVDKHVQRP